MNTLTLGLTDFTLICLIAIFSILVTTVYKVLQEASFFDNKLASFVVSVCVTLLSIIGMMRLFTHDNKKIITADNNVHQNTEFDFLLLPYIVLGIGIIVVLMLKFFFDIYDKYYLRRFNKKCPHDMEKRHFSERKVDDWKSDHEESRIRK